MTTNKLKSLVNFINVVIQNEGVIKNESNSIFYGTDELFILNKDDILTSKVIDRKIIRRLIDDYNLMDETSFVLTHGKDPFSMNDKFKDYMSIFEEIKKVIEI